MPLWNTRSAGSLSATANRVTLAPGETMLLGPQDAVYQVHPGYYSCVQYFDPVMQAWTKIGGGYGNIGGTQLVFSDGVNYRIANQTGAAVGALLTNGGTGYTSPPTVTASAGGSIWRAVIGGAVSTSVTVTNAGLSYTYPPMVLFSAPAFGGVQATGYATLSSNTVSTVTVTNQGAGYSQPPTITFVNDPREGLNSIAYGYNAAAVATTTGAGTVTAVLCVDHGQGGLTTLPTLAFAGGGGSSAAATTIMCWSITAYAVTTAGTGWTTAPYITAYDNFPSTAPAYTNSSTQSGLVATAPAQIIGAVTAGGITATGQNVLFGGIYTSTPTIVMQTSGILITATAALTATMGGQNASVYIQQI
jgi:hypothetical protein